jgi:hypothetical protein
MPLGRLEELGLREGSKLGASLGMSLEELGRREGTKLGASLGMADW